MSLILDLMSFFLEWKIEYVNELEYQEISHRNQERFWKYIWRNPIYHLWRDKILVPLLDKYFPKYGFIKKIILYLIEIKSSLSLLM